MDQLHYVKVKHHLHDVYKKIIDDAFKNVLVEEDYYSFYPKSVHLDQPQKRCPLT